MSSSRPFLQTARLSLREFTLEDTDRLVALDSDPEVMRFISYGAPTPRAVVATKILPSWLEYYARDRDIGFWAAETDGDFIGWFHLRPDRFAPDEQEIGYRLQRRHWGRGFATEGALALIAHGFQVSHFAKISGRTLLGNVSSQNVLRKCGLQIEEYFVYPERILRGGSEEGRRAVKYAATRDAWLARIS